MIPKTQAELRREVERLEDENLTLSKTLRRIALYNAQGRGQRLVEEIKKGEKALKDLATK